MSERKQMCSMKEGLSSTKRLSNDMLQPAGLHSECICLKVGYLGNPTSIAYLLNDLKILM